MMISIQIPVKSHIKKYLDLKYGKQTVSKKTFLGLYVSEMLTKNICASNPFKEEYYELFISSYYFNTKGHSLSKGVLRTLGLSLESLFYEDFYHFVDIKLMEGNLNAYKSVKMFLKIYGISEDELKLESMYRKYQRYCGEKIKNKKKIFSTNLGLNALNA